MNSLLIIAHAPLASALRECALHVFPEVAERVQALDVPAHQAPEQTAEHAAQLVAAMRTSGTLLLSDVFGATPCNVASRLTDGKRIRLLSGVNLPMLLRAISYLHEPLDTLTERAMLGGTQGVMPVAATAPQNQQHRHYHDPKQHHHQQ